MNEISEEILSLKSKLENNPIDIENSLKLAYLYEESNEYIKAAKIYCFLGQFSSEKDFLKNKLTDCIYECGKTNQKHINIVLDEISYISSPVNVFPVFWKFYLDKNGKLNFRIELFLFKFLNKKNSLYNQFVCVHNLSYSGNAYNTAMVLNRSLRGDMHYNIKCEIVEAYISRSMETNNDLSILPIATTKANQIVEFCYKDFKGEKKLNPYEFHYFRINKNMIIKSKNNIIFGKPIKLGHSSTRKKLILDIFIDTLSFKYIQDNSFKDVQEIYSFFNKGIIFSQNYTIGEYTRPVVSGMRSGFYTYKNGMFNDKVNTKINEKYKLTAQLMQERGYMTAEFSGDIGQPSGDLLRGLNRVIVQNGHNYRVAEIIEDTIDHLESFKECDNYVRISLLDIHRAIEEKVNRNILTEVQVPISKRFEKGSGSNSVFEKSTTEKQYEYKNTIRKVDRYLGVLFKYILQNYKENEFLITLTSDHGAMMLDNEDYLLKDIHTNTALMVRGGNIPKKGLYNEELTSVIDLYSIIDTYSYTDNFKRDVNDSNLPSILGGKKREYVISESLYPGQTYKISIRNRKYEFRLETKEKTNYNGKINIGNFNSLIYLRNNKQVVKDKEIEKYFMDIFMNHIRGQIIKNINKR